MGNSKKNYPVLMLLLAAILFNCQSQGSVLVEEPIQLISVEVNLPWYIEFTFPATNGLQPTSFETDVYTEGVRTPLSFFLERKDNRWIYRNTQPYTFGKRDIIAGKLEFDVQSGGKRWIPIYYTITRNRRYDAIAVTESKENNQHQSSTIMPPSDLKIPSNLKTFNIQSSKTIEPQRLDCIPGNPTLLVQSEEEKKNSDSAVSAFTSNTLEKIADLHDEVNSLKELIQTILHHGRIGTKLILIDTQPISKNQEIIDKVRQIISDKLKLDDLQQSILYARLTCGGILFEMAAPVDKARVLTNAAKHLVGSSYSITNADSHNIECNSMQFPSEEAAMTTTTQVTIDSQTAKTLDFRIDELRRRQLMNSQNK